MQLTALDNTLTTQAAQAAQGIQGNPDAFAQMLQHNAGGKDKLRQAAEQLVATALIGPMMSELQKDPFRTEMFHGGFTEQVFNQQLTTMLADRITQRTHLPLVDSIYQQFAGHEAHGLNPWASAGGEVDTHG